MLLSHKVCRQTNILRACTPAKKQVFFEKKVENKSFTFADSCRSVEKIDQECDFASYVRLICPYKGSIAKQGPA